MNRDRDDIAGAPRRADDVDLESGLVIEKEKSTGSGSGSGTIDNDSDENEKNENGNMAESGLSGDTRVALTPGGGAILSGGAAGEGDSVHVGFVDSPGPATRIGTPDATRPATPAAAASGGSGLGVGGLGAAVSNETHQQYQQHQHRHGEDPHAHASFFGHHHTRHPEQRAESDRDYAPDGGPVEDDEYGHTIAEWIEGNQRVIETRRGPGSDVSV